MFDTHGTIPHSQEEKRKAYKDYLVYVTKLNEEERKEEDPLLSFEDFSKKCDKQHLRFDFQALWSNWNAQHPFLRSSKFRFVYLKGTEDERSEGLFINIPNSIFLLRKYHADFVRETKIDFDPYTILNTISDTGSEFWNTVFSNYYLFGLLMGYGEKSSFLFDWHRKQNLENPSVSDCTVCMADYDKAFVADTVTVNDLPLPPFVLFTVSDPVKEHYRLERDAIIKYFHNKDFVSTVLFLLEEEPSAAVYSKRVAKKQNRYLT
jgi:hypothetical protein